MSPKQPPVFSISIVSHGHRALVVSLLHDLALMKRPSIEVLLTWNLQDEAQASSLDEFPFPVINIINLAPKGFAANHNAAFRQSTGENFVILNPDIRLPADPFDALLDVLRITPNAVCAPLILNTRNELEDSARFFPSPLTLLKKAIAKAFRIPLALQPIPGKDGVLMPDWVAGMFMVIPSAIYADLQGLCEKYFLYYEDVDLCARARLRGISILVTSKAFAIHDARRESHRSLRFLTWHIASALKFFTSEAYLTLGLRSLRRSVTG
jgi:GT2 family glycosyltransferase